MAGQQNLGLFIGVRVPVRESAYSPRRALLRGRRLFFTLAAFFVPLPLPAQTPLPAVAPPGAFLLPERSVKQLAPGVEWIQEIVPATAPGGPLVINVVRVTPDAAKRDRLHAALGYGRVWENNATQGRETVSGIAARNNALVAINAGFFTFTSGHPLGLHVENGEPVTEPLLSRTALCVDKDGRGSVAAFTGSGTITATDGATLALNGMNRKPGKGNELLLYTPRFFDGTLPAPDRTEIVLSGVKTVRLGETVTGTVAAKTQNGGTSLARQTVVLSGGGAAAQFLRDHLFVGTKATVRYDVSPDARNIRQAIAGGPRLVRDGAVAVTDIAEGFGGSFSTARHPRTAAGVAADGSLILLTVDGRQPRISRGATLAETASLLLRFGAVNGVNWDGGGSTALAVRGGIVNSPSDGGERPVANAMVLVSTAKPSRVAPRYVTGSGNPGGAMAVGETRRFTLPAKTGKKESDVIWSLVGGTGFVSQSGTFVALRGGSGEVVAMLPGGERFCYAVTVAAPIAPVLPAVIPVPKSP